MGNECEHDYVEVYSDMECEKYECTKCGDRYSLYYDDMQ